MFANPTGVGGFNPDTEAQKSVNHELGLRGDLDNGINYDLTLSWIDVRDELILYTLIGTNDRTFYRNAGDATRKGFETSAGWLFMPSWRIDSALTLARYTFDTYRPDSENYDGNRLPGLPEQTWNNRLYASRNVLLKGFAGVCNLADEDYFANVCINANNDRYFEPAAGCTWYAGLEFVF